MSESAEKNFACLHEHISDIMSKLKHPATGKFTVPYLSVGWGQFYASSIFSWDNHHMTLRYAADGETEQMRYFLETMLAFQCSDGYVPNCSSAVNGAVRSDREFHAQPFLAQNGAIYAAASGDVDFIRTVYPKLEKYLDYWLTHYQAPFGLYRWGETWMSGFDNEICGTIFPSESIIAPDLNAWLHMECRAMSCLAEKIGADGAKWQNKATDIADAVNKVLWDEEMEIYSAFNLHTGKLQTSYGDAYLTSDIGRYAFVSCSSIPVLFAGIAPAERAKSMIEKYILAPEHFRSPYGIRSLSASSEYYNNARWGNPPRFGDFRRLTNSNWQGPVWVPVNWFAFHALLRYGFAKEAESVMNDLFVTLANCIKEYGFMRENFSGDTGEALYADYFGSWNILADLMPDYLHEKTTALSILPWEK